MPETKPKTPKYKWVMPEEEQTTLAARNPSSKQAWGTMNEQEPEVIYKTNERMRHTCVGWCKFRTTFSSTISMVQLFAKPPVRTGLQRARKESWLAHILPRAYDGGENAQLANELSWGKLSWLSSSDLTLGNGVQPSALLLLPASCKQWTICCRTEWAK